MGVDEFGEAHDTTSTIFFDKKTPLHTDSYIKKSESADEKNETLWEFIIPANELNLQASDTSLNVLVNFVYPNEARFTLSRRYNKYTYPLMGYFTRFKNSLELELKE